MPVAWVGNAGGTAEMSIRRMLTVALFMLSAFFGLKGLGAPDWASVLVSVAAGEFLWSKERRRAAREEHNASLRQMIMPQLNNLIRLQKFGAELGRANIEHEAPNKTPLM
jgi:hypothetical protein